MDGKIDQNYLFNKDARVMAVDDAPFSRGSDSTWLVGLIMRVDGTIENLAKVAIKVDGDDANEAIAQLASMIGNGIRMILLQGITFGGFNVADIGNLYERTGIPIAVVIDRMPDMESIEDALRKHFKDWNLKIEKMQNRIYTDGKLYYQFSGIDPNLGMKFVQRFIKNGNYPEPLRMANLIASIL